MHEIGERRIQYTMEIIVLIMLYYLTQNADFEKTVKPLMSGLKSSENLLKFISDLSKFSELFSAVNGKKDGGMDEVKAPKPQQKEKAEEQNSPVSSIANDFIKETLEKYFKNQSSHN